MPASEGTVVLDARDVATGLAGGELDWGLTWPSLVPPQVLANCAVDPLGIFPVHYGFLCRPGESGAPSRIAVQYWDAFAVRSSESQHPGKAAFEIRVLAEEWLAHDMADMAYDSYRTGKKDGRTWAGRLLPHSWGDARRHHSFR